MQPHHQTLIDLYDKIETTFTLFKLCYYIFFFYCSRDITIINYGYKAIYKQVYRENVESKYRCEISLGLCVLFVDRSEANNWM